MARQTAPGNGGTRGGQHEDDDEQGPEREKQEVLQLEPAEVFPGRGDEVSDRGEHDGGWFPAGEKVEKDGDSRAGESRQSPRMKEFDHAAREDAESAPRSTIP